MDDPHKEALRAAERVLDHQVALVLAGHQDLDRLVRLGVAALAGTLAGTGLLLQTGLAFPLPTVVALAAGIFAQTAGTAAASSAAVPSDLVLGPNPLDLYRSISETEPSSQGVREALLEQVALGHRRNARGLERMSLRRRVSSSLLYTGSGSVLGGIAYVVGGGMLG